MKSVADQYFVDKGYRRLFASRGASNGTEKIERYFKSLKAGVRAELVESGFSDFMYFDAAHVFGYHYNRVPTKANRVSEDESPYESLGIKVGPYPLCVMGSFGRFVDKRGSDLPAGNFPVFLVFLLDMALTLLAIVLLFRMVPLFCALRSIMISVSTVTVCSRRLLFVKYGPILLIQICSLG